MHDDLDHFAQAQELLLWRGALVQLPEFSLGTWDVETGNGAVRKKNGLACKIKGRNFSKDIQVVLDLTTKIEPVIMVLSHDGH